MRPTAVAVLFVARIVGSVKISILEVDVEALVFRVLSVSILARCFWD